MGISFNGNKLTATPDGAGLNGGFWPFKTAPAGSDRMVFVIRHWYDALSGVYDEVITAWENAHYRGFTFGDFLKQDIYEGSDSNSSFPHADYFGSYEWMRESGNFNDFNRVGLSPLGGASYGDFRDNYAIVHSDYFYNGATSDKYGAAGFVDGGSTVLTWTSSANFTHAAAPLLYIPANPTEGAMATLVVSIYKHTTDDRVFFEAWINRDSVDLSDFDIATDMDIQNPKALFPVSDGLETSLYTINNAAESGTKWMPNPGEMGFPAGYIFAHPFGDAANAPKYHIDYIGCHYGQPA